MQTFVNAKGKKYSMTGLQCWLICTIYGFINVLYAQKAQFIAMAMQYFADNYRNVAKRLQGCYNLTIRNTNDCRETKAPASKQLTLSINSDAEQLNKTLIKNSSKKYDTSESISDQSLKYK